MKRRMKMMLLASLCFLSLGVMGQTTSFEPRKSSGFSIEEEKVSAGWELSVEDMTFPVYANANGAYYITQISDSGKEYPLWLGKKTEYTYDNKPVFQSSNGSYCIFTLSSRRKVYAVWLVKLENNQNPQ